MIVSTLFPYTHAIDDNEAEHNQQLNPVKPKSDSSSPDLDPGLMSDNDLMDLQRATKEITPPSSHPPNPKFHCPRCNKTYPENQREYFTRHMKQQRCTVVTETADLADHSPTLSTSKWL